MGKKDPRVDTYIKAAKPFAQPILNHFRELVHKHCPEVEETIKWNFPNFEYKGPFCSMAAFKEHCAVGFVKAALMNDGKKLQENNENAMGHIGKLKLITDLPSDKVLTGYLKEAKALNDEGKKVPRKKAEPIQLVIPETLSAALKKDKKAKQIFDEFAPSHKKEYINWITEAKTDATRENRIEMTLQWVKEGKTRMWKYQSKK